MFELDQRITVEYYTDPLCCWSWALEPHLKRLVDTHEVDCQYFMGGLIPEWNTYNDPVNKISKPFQMGRLWRHVSRSLGVKLNPRIWYNNPPSSSYPACVAVKCAERQSKVASRRLLHHLMSAVFLEGKSITRYSSIVAIAKKMTCDEDLPFDVEQFDDDLIEGKGIFEFRKDLILKKKKQISRLPAVIMKNANGKGVIFFGYRSFRTLEDIYYYVKNDVNRAAVEAPVYYP